MIAKALAAIALALGLPATAAAAPQRVMSMDLCDDLLVLMLVPKARIASVTYLAHEATEALMPGLDRGVPINHGTAEEILRQKPDLIIASAYSTPVARRLAKQVGARLVEMPGADSFPAIRAALRTIGSLVGEPMRAEALVRTMDGELARLAAQRPRQPRRVVAWNGGGSVPGRGTLTDAIITAAGAVNIGAKFDDARSSGFDLEELLAARPDAVMQGVSGYAGTSLHSGAALHPLIDRVFAGRQIDYPDAGYTCGLPQSAHAAVELRQALDRLPAGPPRW